MSPLRVGAAKVDVTPAQGELPKNSRGVLDRLYARAIVLESGGTTAASGHTVDAGGASGSDLAGVTSQISAELGFRRPACC